MKYYKANFVIGDKPSGLMADDDMKGTVKDLICGLAGEAGFEAFEDCENGVTGYARKDLFNGQLLDTYMANFPVEDVEISYTLEDAEDRNWNSAWEEGGFEPIIIGGNCIIHDLIHPLPHPETDYVTEIAIDAKQAFGTGTHETTFMIVRELIDSELTGKDVLDCGCGTGILSIAASKLGAVSVTAYDIDEWSVENTIHNCAINKVENVHVMQGDASVIKEMQGCFDLVMANINRNILLSDLPLFAASMKPGGTLLLSGFYEEDAKMLSDKAEALGLSSVSKKTRNKWCMLRFKK